jgi:hypothetical protein
MMAKIGDVWTICALIGLLLSARGECFRVIAMTQIIAGVYNVRTTDGSLIAKVLA